MAILKIARMGHPVLRHRADEIENPSAPFLKALVRDMVATMVDSAGVGLAAPQVHVPLRLVVFHIPEGRTGDEPEDQSVGLQILINPIIEPLGPEMAHGWEGCLSLPGMLGAVPRFQRIRYRGVDLGGQPIDRIAAGFHARVVQHECDHLDGVLYPGRMTDLSLLGYTDELRRESIALPETNPSGIPAERSET